MEFARAAAVLEGAQMAPQWGIAAPMVDDDLARPGARVAMPLSRLRAARTWLFALGYLAEDADRADYDLVLQTAVAKFQREAGLTVDGWVGAVETWPRLQELLAFEHPLDVAFWEIADGQPKEALVRAVRTRLRLYGLPVGPDTDDAVRSFFRRMTDLGTPPESLGISRAQWLAGVLDHDRHLSAIAHATRSAAGRLLLQRDDPMAQGAVSLMLNMAKIELWLAQQETVDLRLSYQARRGFDQIWVLPSSLRRDLGQYMAWVDEERPEAEGLRHDYDRALRRDQPEMALAVFLATAARFGKVADPFRPDRLEDVQRFYGGVENRVPRRAEATVAQLTGPRRFRARLWDGLGRIWSWLRRALRRVRETGRRVLKLARDLAIYAFRLASDGVFHLTEAIGAFLEHARVATSRRITDKRGQICIVGHGGRDMDVLTRVGSDTGYLNTFLESINLSAQIFRRACGVLGGAVGLGVSLAGMAIGAPLVLRTLISAMRDLPRIVCLLREIRSLRGRHRDLVVLLG